MSWAEEDWTVGLSGRVLQKVKELQIHHERLSRENKQKQLQLSHHLQYMMSYVNVFLNDCWMPHIAMNCGRAYFSFISDSSV
uniref:Centromere protein Cenp-F N-terminal domain-containing protein n=1 Tax=Neolamprologus brichardi TaxID=32507 RepID=A0A3Q4G445_NEOBR